MDSNDELNLHARAMGLSRAELDRAIARQLRGQHGRQVAIGAHVENLHEDALRACSIAAGYSPGHEMEGSCDHHVELQRNHVTLRIKVESKSGDYTSYTASHLASSRPNGRVSLGVCKSRLKGLDKLYPTKNSFDVVMTAYLRDGNWEMKGALTSKLPTSKKHPDYIQPRQTIVLDDPESPWVDLPVVLDQAYDEALQKMFRRKASVWFRKTRQT